jgi:hypothetical protein
MEHTKVSPCQRWSKNSSVGPRDNALSKRAGGHRHLLDDHIVVDKEDF